MLGVIKKFLRCILASTLDPITTYFAIGAGAVEGHPMWRALIVEMGLVPAMLLRTLVGIALIVAVAPVVASPRAPIGARTFDMLSAAFMAISAWNIAMMALA